MAFVFKSSKDLDRPIEKEYDILTSKRNHKKKKNSLKKNKTKQNKLSNNFSVKPSIPRKQSAFGSNQKRDFLHLKLNQCSPGPGRYDLDNDFIKRSFNNIITSPENKEHNNDNEFFEENNLKLFISKEERFKNKKNENPGPGEYNIMNLPHIKKGIFNRKNFIKKSKSYLTNKSNREISIPSRGNNYGYIINNKGEKKLEQEPNLLLNKNNNLGPGCYDIKIPASKNNIVDWSKNSSRNIPNKEDDKTKEKYVNNLDIIINELNEIKINDRLLKNMKTEPYNNNNNYNGIFLLNSMDVRKMIGNSLREDCLKKINEIYISKCDKMSDTNEDKNNFRIDNNNHNDNILSDFINVSKSSELNYNRLKLIYDDYHDKLILNEHLKNKPEIPGPGKYSLLGQFENLANFQKNNNFGSSLSRGLLYPTRKNKIKIGRQKLDKNLRIYSSYEENNIENKRDKNYEKNHIDNESNSQKILNENKTVKDSLSLLKVNNDSENKFNTKNGNETKKIYDDNFSNDKTNDFPEYINKKIINSTNNVENFGSLEKRFYEKPIKETTPGVGAYSLVKTQENNINRYKRNFPYNIVIHNLKKSDRVSDFLKNKILNLNHKSPPVGAYSPESKNCIEYDCEQKNRLNSGRKIAFSNEEERFFKLDSQKEFTNDVGKYDIIKDKVEIKQLKAPFSLSEEKKLKFKLLYSNIGNNNDKNLGPGSYRYGSYFDWIKKSYNKHFI